MFQIFADLPWHKFQYLKINVAFTFLRHLRPIKMERMIYLKYCTLLILPAMIFLYSTGGVKRYLRQGIIQRAGTGLSMDSYWILVSSSGFANIKKQTAFFTAK